MFTLRHRGPRDFPPSQQRTNLLPSIMLCPCSKAGDTWKSGTRCCRWSFPALQGMKPLPWYLFLDPLRICHSGSVRPFSYSCMTGKADLVCLSTSCGGPGGGGPRVVHACGGQKLTSDVFLFPPTPCFWNQGLSLNQELSN